MKKNIFFIFHNIYTNKLIKHDNLIKSCIHKYILYINILFFNGNKFIKKIKD